MAGGVESGGGAGASELAARAVERLAEFNVQLRGCCVLDGSGSVLAASGPTGRWLEAAPALLAAADAAGGGAVEQVHVGTVDGEVMAVREAGRAMVAVTERFTLASLLAFDMRQLLRDLDADARRAA